MVLKIEYKKEEAMQLGIASIGAQNSASQNYQAKNRKNKPQNVAFKRIVAEIAKDSQDVRVEKNVRQFFAFMNKLKHEIKKQIKHSAD
jgi:hypothetical protein